MSNMANQDLNFIKQKISDDIRRSGGPFRRYESKSLCVCLMELIGSLVYVSEFENMIVLGGRGGGLLAGK